MIRYNKLVRDNILDQIHSNGGTEKHHIASDEEFEHKLKEKLIEEAKELHEAPDIESIKSELADVLKITEELMKLYTITRAEIDAIMRAKDKKAGEFDKRIILEEASEF